MTGHVLVARLDNLGDVLLAGPAVRAIAAGSTRVTMLAGPNGAEAAAMLPGVDQVEVFRAPWIDPDPEPLDPEAVEGLRERLSALRPDRLVILTSFHQSPLPLALVARMAGVPHVSAISPDYPGSLLDVRHTVDGSLHEVERALSLAARLGYSLPAGDDGRLRVRGVRRHSPTRPGVPYVVVHPGCSVPARTWPAGRFADLVDLLAAGDTSVFLTGARSERGLVARIAGEPRPGVVDLSGRTDLAGLAAVLSNACVLVTGNTGPAHLAAAVGAPVVSVFPPTVPAFRWRPWGVPTLVLGDQDIGCAGCRAQTCPVPGHPCVSSVLPEQVLDAIRRLSPVLRPVRAVS